ncbi:hypothetical protein IJ596_03265 [bacterium]|nr:hypothetical protein [bacterium]
MPVSPAPKMHNTKIGSCPHGWPPGACPICSGGGGNSTTRRDIPRNPGEMTYNQCAAIGAMIKANKAAQKRALNNEQNRLQALIDFQKNIQNIHQKILDLASTISKTTPAIISKPVNFVLTQIIGRFVQFIANIPSAIINITQKIVDIADKLNAIYGECKAAIEKTVSDIWQKTKKKLKSIFFIFGTDNDEDDDKKIDETKKIFSLKTFIHKLSQKLKHENKEEKDAY